MFEVKVFIQVDDGEPKEVAVVRGGSEATAEEVQRSLAEALVEVSNRLYTWVIRNG